MLGTGKILDSSELDLNEYYRILNCNENSSAEQINAEFKILALECHPDKNPGNMEALTRFQALQEARDILLDPIKRNQYDKWRRSEVSFSFKDWVALSNRCQPTMHWAKKKEQVMIQSPKTDAEVSTAKASSDFLLSKDEKVETGEVTRGKWVSERAHGLYQKFRTYKI